MKKVLINGANGKMGQALIRLIQTHPELGLSVSVKRENQENPIADFDIIIDFSTPQGAQEAFALAKHYHKPFLTGTTNLPETFLFQMQQEEKIPVFYAPNVSLSVYFFTELVRKAAQMYAGYEIKMNEIHHIHKKMPPAERLKKSQKPSVSRPKRSAVSALEKPSAHIPYNILQIWTPLP